MLPFEGWQVCPVETHGISAGLGERVELFDVDCRL